MKSIIQDKMNSGINKVKMVIYCVLAIFVMASSSWAAAYYVDAAIGNDSYSGATTDRAWKTISKVNAMSFKPGDVVYFKRGGIWNETLSPDSGINGSLITYDAYGTGAKPIIRNLYADNKSYIKFAGIEFKTGGSYTPVALVGSHHIILENCNIYADAACPSYAALWILRNSHYNEVLGCNIEHRNISQQNDVVNLRLNANYNIIKGNTIRGGTHSVLSSEGSTYEFPNYTCSYNIIKDNYMENNDSALLLCSNSNNNLVEGNTIVGGKTPGASSLHARSFKNVSKNNILRNNIVRDNASATGASGIATEVYRYQNDPPNQAIGNHIYNNIITNIANYPIVIASNGNDGVVADENFYKNNIVYENPASYQIVVQKHEDIQDNYFENNIIFKSGVSKVINITGDRTYTVAEKNTADPLHWSGNLQADPKLDSDFRPLAGSPCIDGGDYLTTVTSTSGSGSTFSVSDAGYFTDGFGIGPADTIRVGNATAVIRSIDYANNTITLTTSVSWVKGAPVSLPFNGSKPDIGAFEAESAPVPMMPPNNLKVTPKI